MRWNVLDDDMQKNLHDNPMIYSISLIRPHSIPLTTYYNNHLIILYDNNPPQIYPTNYTDLPYSISCEKADEYNTPRLLSISQWYTIPMIYIQSIPPTLFTHEISTPNIKILKTSHSHTHTHKNLQWQS